MLEGPFLAANPSLNGFFGCKTPISVTFFAVKHFGGAAKAKLGWDGDGDGARMLAPDTGLVLGEKARILGARRQPANGRLRGVLSMISPFFLPLPGNTPCKSPSVLLILRTIRIKQPFAIIMIFCMKKIKPQP